MLLIPIYLFIFLKIGNFHVLLWDESWFAVHAYEMLQNNSWLIPYFNGEPAIHGTKPPMQSWLQMLSISIFGYSEMVLRLPSAIAASMTVLLVFHFVKSNVGNFAAWIAAMILLTTSGFVNFHAARGMEADALLTLMMLVQGIFIWKYIKTNERKHLIYAGLFIGVAFWVKGVAGFLMTPAWVIALVYHQRKSLLNLVGSYHMWVGLVLAIGLSGFYMVLRESLQPGYLDFVLKMQAGRAISDVGHDQPFDYYYQLLIDSRFTYWFIFGAVGVVIPFITKHKEDSFFQFMSITTLVFLITVSIARSKLQWYMVPVYPFLAISTSAFIRYVLEKLDKKVSIVFCVLLFWFPSHAMFQKSQQNILDDYVKSQESQEEFLYQAYRNKKNVHGLKVLHKHTKGALLFYQQKFKELGQTITLQTDAAVSVGDVVLVRDKTLIDQIHKGYHTETIEQESTALLLRINDLRIPKTENAG